MGDEPADRAGIGVILRDLDHEITGLGVGKPFPMTHQLDSELDREDGELLVLDRLHTTALESMAAATSATVGERARRAPGGSKGATPGSSSR